MDSYSKYQLEVCELFTRSTRRAYTQYANDSKDPEGNMCRRCKKHIKKDPKEQRQNKTHVSHDKQKVHPEQQVHQDHKDRHEHQVHQDHKDRHEQQVHQDHKDRHERQVHQDHKGRHEHQVRQDHKGRHEHQAHEDHKGHHEHQDHHELQVHQEPPIVGSYVRSDTSARDVDVLYKNFKYDKNSSAEPDQVRSEKLQYNKSDERFQNKSSPLPETTGTHCRQIIYKTIKKSGSSLSNKSTKTVISCKSGERFMHFSKINVENFIEESIRKLRQYRDKLLEQNGAEMETNRLPKSAISGKSEASAKSAVPTQHIEELDYGLIRSIFRESVNSELIAPIKVDFKDLHKKQRQNEMILINELDLLANDIVDGMCVAHYRKNLLI